MDTRLSYLRLPLEVHGAEVAQYLPFARCSLVLTSLDTKAKVSIMEQAGHCIEIDPDRAFMRVTLWGEWANRETDGLVVDHAKAVQAMKAAGVEHGSFLTLVDMRSKRLDEQNTIAEFRKSFEAGSPSRRTAIIVSPVLPTSIAAKIAPASRVLVTHSEQEATDWLFRS